MKKYQKLEPILFFDRKGLKRKATRNGNNAAWVCCSDNCDEPLLGMGIPSHRDNFVRCPSCEATYMVKFENNKPVSVEVNRG